MPEIILHGPQCRFVGRITTGVGCLRVEAFLYGRGLLNVLCSDAGMQQPGTHFRTAWNDEGVQVAMGLIHMADNRNQVLAPGRLKPGNGPLFPRGHLGSLHWVLPGLGDRCWMRKDGGQEGVMVHPQFPRLSIPVCGAGLRDTAIMKLPHALHRKSKDDLGGSRRIDVRAGVGSSAGFGEDEINRSPLGVRFPTETCDMQKLISAHGTNFGQRLARERKKVTREA